MLDKLVVIKTHMWGDISDCLKIVAMDNLHNYVYRQVELGESLPPVHEFIDNYVQSCDMLWIYRVYFRVYVTKRVLRVMDVSYALDDAVAQKVMMLVVQFGCDELPVREEENHRLTLSQFMYLKADSFTHMGNFLRWYALDDDYRAFWSRRRDPDYIVGACSQDPGYELMVNTVKRHIEGHA